MKRTQYILAAAGIAVAFLAGQLTAQPPAPGKAPPKITQTPRQIEFMADLSAAIKSSNNARANKMLAQASGDTELTDAVTEKTLDYSQRDSPAERVKGEVMQSVFAAHQEQRQIEIWEEILVELKKRPAAKE